MRKLIIISSLLLMLFQHVIAQNPEPVDATTGVKNIDISKIDKFAGTWEWKSDQEQFLLVLNRKNFGSGIFMLNGY